MCGGAEERLAAAPQGHGVVAGGSTCGGPLPLRSLHLLPTSRAAASG